MLRMMHAADVVEEIDELELAGVDVWVQGGWGIDALLGEQTRPHDDLDVIIRADDIETTMQEMSVLTKKLDGALSVGLTRYWSIPGATNYT